MWLRSRTRSSTPAPTWCSATVRMCCARSNCTRGKLIAYSLGNFLAYERFNLDGPNGVSVVLTVHLDAATGDFQDGELVPVKLGTQGIPVPDSGRKAITLIRNLTKQDIKDPGLIIADDGALRLKNGKVRQVQPSSSATVSAVTGTRFECH